MVDTYVVDCLTGPGFSPSVIAIERAMEANHEGTSGLGAVPEGETGVGETVEIKIKTLDSQSYTLRVEKNVSPRKNLS